jgi:hypothetical protein
MLAGNGVEAQSRYTSGNIKRRAIPARRLNSSMIANCAISRLDI